MGCGYSCIAAAFGGRETVGPIGEYTPPCFAGLCRVHPLACYLSLRMYQILSLSSIRRVSQSCLGYHKVEFPHSKSSTALLPSLIGHQPCQKTPRPGLVTVDFSIEVGGKDAMRVWDAKVVGQLVVLRPQTAKDEENSLA